MSTTDTETTGAPLPPEADAVPEAPAAADPAAPAAGATPAAPGIGDLVIDYMRPPEPQLLDKKDMAGLRADAGVTLQGNKYKNKGPKGIMESVAGAFGGSMVWGAAGAVLGGAFAFFTAPALGFMAVAGLVASGMGIFGGASAAAGAVHGAIRPLIKIADGKNKDHKFEMLMQKAAEIGANCKDAKELKAEMALLKEENQGLLSGHDRHTGVAALGGFGVGWAAGSKFGFGIIGKMVGGMLGSVGLVKGEEAMNAADAKLEKALMAAASRGYEKKHGHAIGGAAPAAAAPSVAAPAVAAPAVAAPSAAPAAKDPFDILLGVLAEKLKGTPLADILADEAFAKLDRKGKEQAVIKGVRTTVDEMEDTHPMLGTLKKLLTLISGGKYEDAGKEAGMITAEQTSELVARKAAKEVTGGAPAPKPAEVIAAPAETAESKAAANEIAANLKTGGTIADVAMFDQIMEGKFGSPAFRNMSQQEKLAVAITMCAGSENRAELKNISRALEVGETDKARAGVASLGGKPAPKPEATSADIDPSRAEVDEFIKRMSGDTFFKGTEPPKAMTDEMRETLDKINESLAKNGKPIISEDKFLEGMGKSKGESGPMPTPGGGKKETIEVGA